MMKDKLNFVVIDLGWMCVNLLCLKWVWFVLLFCSINMILNNGFCEVLCDWSKLFIKYLNGYFWCLYVFKFIFLIFCKNCVYILLGDGCFLYINVLVNMFSICFVFLCICVFIILLIIILFFWVYLFNNVIIIFIKNIKLVIWCFFIYFWSSCFICWFIVNDIIVLFVVLIFGLI